MKKKMLLWLGAMIMVLGLAACGSKEEESGSSTYSSQTDSEYTEATFDYTGKVVNKLSMTYSLNYSYFDVTEEEMANEDVQEALKETAEESIANFGEGDGISAKYDISDKALVLMVTYDFDKMSEETFNEYAKNNGFSEGSYMSVETLLKAFERDGLEEKK